MSLTSEISFEYQLIPRSGKLTRSLNFSIFTTFTISTQPKNKFRRETKVTFSFFFLVFFSSYVHNSFSGPSTPSMKGGKRGDMCGNDNCINLGGDFSVVIGHWVRHCSRALRRSQSFITRAMGRVCVREPEQSNKI